jgi:mitogen-activated protein kinase 1/3
MDDIFADSEDCKKMVREVLLLKAMNSSFFITKLLDIVEPRDINNFKDLYIVIDYVEADLKKVIKSSLSLSELHIQVIVYNLLCSLNWIHSAHVLHRDIKPSNILIDEDCRIKLCDFGLARSYSGLNVDPNKYFEEAKTKIEETNQ